MATVRMSQQLRNDVIARANLIFNKKADAVKERPLPPEWTADHIYETAIAPWKEHMDKLPDMFFNRFSELSINVNGVTRSLRLPAPKPFPFKFPDTHYVRTAHSYMSNSWLLRDDANCAPTPFQPLIDTLLAQQRELVTIQANKEAFVFGVSKVLGAHSTLAPALKAWPALWDLLPDDTKEQHKRIATKNSVVKPELDDVDVASLTATVVMTKMGL